MEINLVGIYFQTGTEMTVSHRGHYTFSLSIPQHTGGWSHRERLGNAAAAERKKGRFGAWQHLCWRCQVCSNL